MIMCAHMQCVPVYVHALFSMMHTYTSISVLVLLELCEQVVCGEQRENCANKLICQLAVKVTLSDIMVSSVPSLSDVIV